MLGLNNLSVSSNDQGLVLGTDSREDLHPVMNKIIFSFSNEIIVDSVYLTNLIFKSKVLYFVALLFELSIFILQLNNLAAVQNTVIVSAFNHNNFVFSFNHTCKYGSLNA